MRRYDEDTLVQQTSAEFLHDVLDWEPVLAYNSETYGSDGTLGRMDDTEVVLRPTLLRKLEELNPGLPAEAYNDAVRQLTEYSAAQTPLQINREKHALMRDGVRVTFRNEKGGQESPRLKVFDFETVTNNEFLAVRELWVQGPVYHKRPDLVGFVNGLPLVVMEFKNVDKPLRTAYDKNISDYRDTIPHLFHHNALVVLGNGVEARYGTFSSPYQYFHEWKRLEEEEPGTVDMETLLKGVCSKGGLLSMFEHFIVFDDSTGQTLKMVARNNQVLGVRRAYCAIQEREERDGKLGVFWHTQGSGKSLSMVFLSRMVHRTLGGNYTFLILTDREDLDTQIYQTFAGCGLVDDDRDPVRATSGPHLKELLGRQKRHVFTLIQKFNQEVGSDEDVYSSRDDIIVIADEAHRTQYGDFALTMRDALPNASYMAFTGTPLFTEDEITRRVFGDYVSTYDFQRAVEDRATVPLYYDARGERLGLVTDDLNERIAAKLEELEIEDQDVAARLEREMRRDYHVITAEKRLESVARDFVEHYSALQFDEDDVLRKGKAMLVCIDKVTCVRMYNLIEHFWDKRIAHLEEELPGITDAEEADHLGRRIAWMKETRAAVVVSEEQGEVDKFRTWGLDIVPHRKLLKEGFEYEERGQERRIDVESAFKREDHPFRIAIVCAMWLTGFDVPSLETLYLDKPLKAHTLMQAIARANRVHEGKNNGLIVDYCGILKNLRKALATFAGHGDTSREGRGKGLPPEIDPVRPESELLAELAEALEAVRDLLSHGGVSLGSITGSEGFERNKAIVDAKEVVNRDDATRREFILLAHTVFAKFRSCMALGGASAHREARDAVHIIYKSLARDVERADISGIVRELHAVVDEAIDVAPNHHPASGTVGERDDRLYDISQINFDLLRQEFARQPGKNTTVQNLKHAVQRKLNRLMQQNPLRADLQERYEDIVDAYNSEKDRLKIEQTFESLLRLGASLSEEEERHVREGLSEESLAVFDLLNKDTLSKQEINRIKEVAEALIDKIKEALRTTSDWRTKEATRDEMRTRIVNFLYEETTGLPYPTYSEEEVEVCATTVYQHVLRVYDTATPAIYSQAA